MKWLISFLVVVISCGILWGQPSIVIESENWGRGESPASKRFAYFLPYIKEVYLMRGKTDCEKLIKLSAFNKKHRNSRVIPIKEPFREHEIQLLVYITLLTNGGHHEALLGRILIADTTQAVFVWDRRTRGYRVFIEESGNQKLKDALRREKFAEINK
jgi:hypothetical protein